jgi:hypothetical protein
MGRRAGRCAPGGDVLDGLEIAERTHVVALAITTEA